MANCIHACTGRNTHQACWSANRPYGHARVACEPLHAGSLPRCGTGCGAGQHTWRERAGCVTFMLAMRRSLVAAQQGTIHDLGTAGASVGATGQFGQGGHATAGRGRGSQRRVRRGRGRRGAPAGLPDRSTIEMVERAVFLHHPYENRERLRSILPRKTGVQALDRALEHLERSGKIAIEDEAIRWAAGAAGPDASRSVKRGGAPAADTKSILAGTCFEWMEEDRLPTETVGEYIVRIYNAHEQGSYTADDAKEFDEGMHRMAKGEYYTHEQVWKEYGL